MTTLPILFEHQDFLIVHKPVGVAMHDSETGIIPLTEQQTGITGLHLCHRLDTGTSGCLLLARNPDSAAYVGELFASRKIQKYYLALLDSKPKKKQGTVSGDMKNRRGGQHILLKSQLNPAVTQFFSQSLVPGIRVAIVKPLSGKTHQIRVAMKSLGAPLLGDELYGGTASDRMYLHAWGLNFDYRGQHIECFSPPQQGEYFSSPQFNHWLDIQENPQRLPWPGAKYEKADSAQVEGKPS
ncbi:TIGR01621 family pseudouridine synthase [Alteromonas aestuariivivens]|uniref:TIGR01621 family pseudouridine synthase n=1 Tax=Alteromonas aestuariivivens TaxID=1938339 RepID=A0A3D8M5X8_9ALTE|nr:TIGR01621 family pseudouridine synthase [Alteromonas aestuariivivens]RDV25153.1 TIGR01621 family pseudouridine synthase [Alteromonas aestuariivivens]